MDTTIANDLRLIASDVDHAPSDYLLFRRERVVDELVISSVLIWIYQIHLDLDPAVFAGLQDAAGQLHMCSKHCGQPRLENKRSSQPPNFYFFIFFASNRAQVLGAVKMDVKTLS